MVCRGPFQFFGSSPCQPLRQLGPTLARAQQLEGLMRSLLRKKEPAVWAPIFPSKKPRTTRRHVTSLTTGGVETAVQISCRHRGMRVRRPRGP